MKSQLEPVDYTRFRIEEGCLVHRSQCHRSVKAWIPEEGSAEHERLCESKRAEPSSSWMAFDELAAETGKELWYVAYLVSIGKVSGSMKSKKASLGSLEAHLDSRKKP